MIPSTPVRRRGRPGSLAGQVACALRVHRLPWLLLLGVTTVVTLGACARPDEPSVETLIDRLKSVDDRNRKPAARKLAAMGDRIVPRLLQEMGSDYTQVRFEVAHLLGRLRDPRAVPVLIRALDDKSANVAQTAAWALGSIRSAQAVPALLRYAHDVSPGVRKQVAWALGACRLDSLEPAVADSARAVVLRALDDPAAEVRQGAVLGLRELGLRGGVDKVVALAADSSAEVRYLVVQLLDQLDTGAYRQSVGELSPPTRTRIADALIGLLDADEPQSIRTRAIRALGHSHDPRARVPLIRLRDGGTAEDRAEAARALRWLASG